MSVGVEAADQPPVVGGDAGRAVSGLAALGLDAADGHHRFARHADHVAAESEREGGARRESEASRSDPHDAISQAGLGEDAPDAREADPERQRNVIGERQGGCARSAFAAIDLDEVDATSGRLHQPRKVLEDVFLSDCRLDADRQPAGALRELLDEIEQ